MIQRYTPNKIANEIMAEDAWHDSLWIREADHLAALAAKDAEIARLNGFLERQTGEVVKQAARAERAEQEAAGLRLDLELLFSLTRGVELYNMLYPHYVMGTGVDGLRAALAAARAGGGVAMSERLRPEDAIVFRLCSRFQRGQRRLALGYRRVDDAGQRRAHASGHRAL